MRKDLNKLLCERERRNSGERFHPRRHAKKFLPQGDDGIAAHQEGMKVRYGFDDKSFGENLRPLLGQVRKYVGRRWDTFYSDLSKNFDMRAVVNAHLLVHLNMYVERDVFEGPDGQIYVRNHYGPAHPIKTSNAEFYVDPRNGIIRRNKWRISHRAANKARIEEARRAEALVFRQLEDGNVLRKVDDVWFLIVVKEAPVGRFVYDKPRDKHLFKPHQWSRETTWERLRDHEKKRCGVKRFEGETAFDVITGQHVFSEEGKPPVKYNASKRTASHKILRDAGIVEH